MAMSSDSAYYRALILSENQTDKQAHVLFIDYGDECDVSFDVVISAIFKAVNLYRVIEVILHRVFHVFIDIDASG